MHNDLQILSKAVIYVYVKEKSLRDTSLAIGLHIRFGIELLTVVSG